MVEFGGKFWPLPLFENFGSNKTADNFGDAFVTS